MLPFLLAPGLSQQARQPRMRTTAARLQRQPGGKVSRAGEFCRDIDGQPLWEAVIETQRRRSPAWPQWGSIRRSGAGHRQHGQELWGISSALMSLQGTASASPTRKGQNVEAND